jgi:hypothetical protein
MNLARYITLIVRKKVFWPVNSPNDNDMKFIKRETNSTGEIMRSMFTLLSLLTLTSVADGQNIIDWDGNYQLHLSDFKSPTTEIGDVNIYSLHTASGIDFSFAMSHAEFMFTKNFNAKVNCSFKRDAASLVALDSAFAQDLVNFARYEFDLSELFARKFRKRLYEEKGAFSDISFFKPVYDAIQKEFTERDAIAGKQTEFGRKKERLNELHQEVLAQIGELSDFCKICKPSKKKK